MNLPEFIQKTETSNAPGKKSAQPRRTLPIKIEIYESAVTGARVQSSQQDPSTSARGLCRRLQITTGRDGQGLTGCEFTLFGGQFRGATVSSSGRPAGERQGAAELVMPASYLRHLGAGSSPWIFFRFHAAEKFCKLSWSGL